MATRLDDATAVYAGNGSVVRLGADDVSGATTGLATAGSGVVAAWSDNHIGANASDGVVAQPLSFG